MQTGKQARLPQRLFATLMLAGLAGLAGLTAGLLAGCGLPPRGEPPETATLPVEATAATPLAQSIARETATHPDLTGIDPLADPLASFAARVDLIRAAQRTLDVQYYIWRNDLTGKLLLDEVRDAAERGVRVRLLLDDNGVPSSLDALLRALASHPNIEVRLFNPFAVRWPKQAGFLTDFRRLNRRMHNKSLTADGVASIVGGRNIGDEYFGATDGVVFADLDVLAIGPAARDIALDFDRYWASQSAYPIALLVATADNGALDAALRDLPRDPASSRYVQALDQVTDVDRLLRGELPLLWARTTLVSDDPAKILGQADPAQHIFAQLHAILGNPRRELDLVSPYFVPGESGTEFFEQLAASGVKVRILTNSLEATDVLPVHSGYARRRAELVRAGITLYELRRAAGQTAQKYYSVGMFGSSGSSLHAKTFSIDTERVFVGSLNFDPRSANLNTELGFVIDSPELAARIEAALWNLAPKLAYEVRLDSDDRLYWLRQSSDGPVRYGTEPNSTWYQRAAVYLFSILPIEWLL